MARAVRGTLSKSPFQLDSELRTQLDRFANRADSLSAPQRPRGKRKGAHADVPAVSLRVRRNRALAAASHGGEVCALGRNALIGLEVVQPLANGRHALISSADFNADGPLPNTGEHHLRVKDRAHQTGGHALAFQTALGGDPEMQSGQTRQGKQRRVDLRVIRQLLQSRKNVPAYVRNLHPGV